MPIPLYLAGKEEIGSRLTGDIPASWTPGRKVWLRGPAGRGFHLPVQARRVALVSFTGSFARLAPVANAAILNGAAVSLFSPSLPAGLPAEVEALPLQALGEARGWADYAALEAEAGQIEDVIELLGCQHGPRIPFPAEILISTRFACAGASDCGVCAVKAGRRYRLVCKDGPVFDLNSFL